MLKRSAILTIVTLLSFFSGLHTADVERTGSPLPPADMAYIRTAFGIRPDATTRMYCQRHESKVIVYGVGDKYGRSISVWKIGKKISSTIMQRNLRGPIDKRRLSSDEARCAYYTLEQLYNKQTAAEKR